MKAYVTLSLKQGFKKMFDPLRQHQEQRTTKTSNDGWMFPLFLTFSSLDAESETAAQAQSHLSAPASVRCVGSPVRPVETFYVWQAAAYDARAEYEGEVGHVAIAAGLDGALRRPH